MFSGERCQISTLPEIFSCLLGFGCQTVRNPISLQRMKGRSSYPHVQRDPYPSNWITPELCSGAVKHSDESWNNFSARDLALTLIKAKGCC